MVHFPFKAKFLKPQILIEIGLKSEVFLFAYVTFDSYSLLQYKTDITKPRSYSG